MSAPTGSQLRRPRRRRVVWWVLIVCLLGAAYRLTLAARLYVGYDEVFVMALGLDDMKSSLMETFFFVPIRRSNGMTPLWWWVQLPSELIGPHVSLFSLRLVPALLGLATLPLVWWMYVRRIGRGSTALLLLFVAGSDILAFCNSRGEFAESLLVPLTLAALALAGDGRRHEWRGLLWTAILMTHLGKGLFIVGTLLLVDAVLLWLSRPVSRGQVREAVATSLLGVVPTVAWLLVVNAVVFAAGPVTTDYQQDAGISSVLDGLGKLTVDYATTKSFMVAEPFDALQPYLDLAIWPTTAASAMWLAGAMALSLSGLRQGGRRLGRRGRLAAASALAGTVFAVALVLRGTCAGRFHLMYLPALWLAAALTLWRSRRLLSGRQGAYVLLAWAVYLGCAASWRDWHARSVDPARALVFAAVLIPAVAVSWWALRHASARSRMALPGTAVIACVVGAVLRGPVWWGTFSRFEPFRSGNPDKPNQELVAIDAYRSGRGGLPQPYVGSLHLFLANFWMQEKNLLRAEFFVRRAAETSPGNPTVWFYLGEVYRRQGRPTEEIEQAWRKSLALKDNLLVRQRLAELRAGSPGPATPGGGENPPPHSQASGPPNRMPASPTGAEHVKTVGRMAAGAARER